jgi:hypothetical protein
MRRPPLSTLIVWMPWRSLSASSAARKSTRSRPCSRRLVVVWLDERWLADRVHQYAGCVDYRPGRFHIHRILTTQVLVFSIGDQEDVHEGGFGSNSRQ